MMRSTSDTRQIGCSFRDLSDCSYFQENAPAQVTKPHRANFGRENLFVVLPSADIDDDPSWDALFEQVESTWQGMQPNGSVTRLGYDDACIACAALRAGSNVMIDTTMAERSRWLPNFLRHLYARSLSLMINGAIDLNRVHLINQGTDPTLDEDTLQQVGLRYTNYQPHSDPEYDLITLTMQQRDKQVGAVMILQQDSYPATAMDAYIDESIEIEDIEDDDDIDEEDSVVDEAPVADAPAGDLFIFDSPDEEQPAEAHPVAPPAAKKPAASQAPVEDDDDDIPDLTYSPELRHLTQGVAYDEPPPERQEVTQTAEQAEVEMELEGAFENDKQAIDIEVEDTWDPAPDVRENLLKRYRVLKYFENVLKQHTKEMDDLNPINEDKKHPLVKAEARLQAGEGNFYEAYKLFQEAKESTHPELHPYIKSARRLCIQNFNLQEAVQAFFSLPKLAIKLNTIRPLDGSNDQGDSGYRSEFRFTKSGSSSYWVPDTVLPIYIYSNLTPNDLGSWGHDLVRKTEDAEQRPPEVGNRGKAEYRIQALRHNSGDDYVLAVIVTRNSQQGLDLLEAKLNWRQEEPAIRFAELDYDDLVHCLLDAEQNPDSEHCVDLLRHALEVPFGRFEHGADTLLYARRGQVYEATRLRGYETMVEHLQNHVKEDKDFILIDPTGVNSIHCIEQLIERSHADRQGNVSNTIYIPVDLSQATNNISLRRQIVLTATQAIDDYFAQHLYSDKDALPFAAQYQEMKDQARRSNQSEDDLNAWINNLRDLSNALQESEAIGAERIVILLRNVDNIVDYLSERDIREFLGTLRDLTLKTPNLTLGILTDSRLLDGNGKAAAARRNLNGFTRFTLSPANAEAVKAMLRHTAYANWEQLPDETLSKIYDISGGRLDIACEVANLLHSQSDGGRKIYILPETERSLVGALLEKPDIARMFANYFGRMPADREIIRKLAVKKFKDTTPEDDLWTHLKNSGYYRAQFTMALSRLEAFGFIQPITNQGPRSYNITTGLLYHWAKANLPGDA